jgi:hypothetical protein
MFDSRRIIPRQTGYLEISLRQGLLQTRAEANGN